MNIAQHVFESLEPPARATMFDLEFSTSLDDVLGLSVEQSPFGWSEEESKRRTAGFVFEGFAEHVASCPAYARYVERLGYAAPSSPGYDDIGWIPVIPTYAFKRGEVLSTGADCISKWCTSSGTQGVMSRVGRDRRTLERLLRTLEFGVEHLLGTWPEAGVKVINLGPSLEEAGNIWMAYVTALVELSWETDSTTDLAQAARLIQLGLEEIDHIVLLGPPFLIAGLIDHARREGIRFGAGERMHVLSAGGWKRNNGGSLPRADFEQTVVDAFSLPDASFYRDIFNQVELNTVFYECEQHGKHVPPWVFACTRDPASLEPLPAGEAGLLSFYDATAKSYPAFVVGDDVGRIDERCACGRTGQVVRIDRRIVGSRDRGCALAIDRNLAARGEQP